MANQANSNVSFISLKSFKTKFNVQDFSVLRNPNTGKLFAVLTFDDGTEETMRVQADIDLSSDKLARLSIMTSEKLRNGDWDFLGNGCLINGGEGAEVIASGL